MKTTHILLMAGLTIAGLAVVPLPASAETCITYLLNPQTGQPMVYQCSGDYTCTRNDNGATDTCSYVKYQVDAAGHTVRVFCDSNGCMYTVDGTGVWLWGAYSNPGACVTLGYHNGPCVLGGK